ncbi:MAG TPA: recombinase [Lachnospiraceae bacterium]|nr:recombinase [Lachnospiraceae bacterium]
MKNPNGYGTVVKLSGKRRNPYCARKTVGFNEKGYPIYKAVGYYKTRSEALIALGEYNHNPYDIDLAKITLKELYERWSKRAFPKMPEKTMRSHQTSFKHMRLLHDTPYRKIKAFQMQDVIDNCGRGYSTQGQIKTLFGKLDEYAMELDVIVKKNSDLIHSAPIEETKKEPFTDEEVKALLKIKNQPWVDSVLFLLHTGLRITELLGLKSENVNLDEMTMVCGIKTAAGKNRTIPIHPDIEELVKRRIEEGNTYLFALDKEIPMKRHQYIKMWDNIMEQIGAHHTPHECRHTLRSKLDAANANKKCIDMIMGHKSKDVGLRVYTHKTVEDLHNAIRMIKYY